MTTRTSLLAAALAASLIAVGCIAPQVEEPSPTADAPAPTITPSATPAPGPTYAPDTVFEPLDQFDFERLPEIDTSDWVTHVGPLGTLRVKAPADWTVHIQQLVDVGPPLGDGQPMGDLIQLTKQGDEPIREGPITVSGYVRIDVRTQRQPTRIDDSSEDIVLRRATLDLDGQGDRTPQRISVTHFGPSDVYDEYRGSVFMDAEHVTVDSSVLTARAFIHFDARAEDVAIAAAVLESAEIIQ